ncbi:DEAD/DEAH box helicase [Luteibacter sp. HA06]
MLIEERVLASMGLFYKLQEPTSLYSFLMARMGQANKTADGAVLTPVQASVRQAIDDNQFVSISAPTSAGKSYSIRDFIATDTGDAVIVVPSRALIAEFIATLRSHFAGSKGVMVMPFVDRIFKNRDLRRIFVLTPERAREIFDKHSELNVRVFFFDEAQVSEEAGRGVVFDVLVRRVKTHFPNAKLIFAHPFVENPEAQFAKHGLYGEASFSKSYSQGTVGKVFVFRHSNESDYYFSPFEQGGSRLVNCAEFRGGFAKFALDGEKSILSYVSKASIYSGKFTEELDGYIRNLPHVDAPEALGIIERIKEMLGADDAGHRSRLISLMQQGVVIHHGSVPLEVRFLIEDFIRGGYARLCFATSTLAQGA